MAPKKAGAPGKGLINWDAQLAADAALAKKIEAKSASGTNFSLKGGLLQFGGASLPNNRMAVVILASGFINQFYEGAYSDDARTGPTCFAVAGTEDDMAPHESVGEGQQAEACAACPMNAWGSADTGRGKACKNGRRLALLSAGTVDAQGRLTMETDPAAYGEQAIGLLSLSPTNVKAFAAYVAQLANTLKRPPYAVVTLITVVPDAQTQFRVVYEAMENIPGKLAEMILQRREEATELVLQPVQVKDPNAAPAPAPRGRAKAAPARAAAPRAAARPLPAARPRAAAAPAPAARQPRAARAATPAPAPRAARQAASPLMRPADARPLPGVKQAKKF
jgi:hypothetical protein